MVLSPAVLAPPLTKSFNKASGNRKINFTKRLTGYLIISSVAQLNVTGREVTTPFQ